jgi:hypothetical protein
VLRFHQVIFRASMSLENLSVHWRGLGIPAVSQVVYLFEAYVAILCPLRHVLVCLSFLKLHSSTTSFFLFLPAILFVKTLKKFVGEVWETIFKWSERRCVVLVSFLTIFSSSSSLPDHYLPFKPI